MCVCVCVCVCVCLCVCARVYVWLEVSKLAQSLQLDDATYNLSHMIS